MNQTNIKFEKGKSLKEDLQLRQMHAEMIEEDADEDSELIIERQKSSDSKTKKEEKNPVNQV